MPDLGGLTGGGASSSQAEERSSAIDGLAGILATIEQGAAAYPEKTQAIAGKLEAMAGGHVPSKESLLALAGAVQTVWSAGDFTAADAQSMASSLNGILSSADIPLPAWVGKLKSVQNLLKDNGVSGDVALAFASELKDYVVALGKN